MVSSQHGIVSPVDPIGPIMMPISQNLMVISAPQIMNSVAQEMETVVLSGIGINQDVQGPQMQPNMPPQHSLDLDASGYPIPQLPHTGVVTTAGLTYPTPLPTAESMTSFTPMVPSMQPTSSHPSSTNSSPAFTPSETAIASIVDPSKRHRRHPSSGQHSPELRIMMQRQDFQQQQQQLMAAKQALFANNVHRVEPHQTRSPRAAAAAGLKINVADLQSRTVPLSTLGSPTDGHLCSPGPLSAPSPILGPNAFVDTISSTFQLHNINDVPQPSVLLKEVKLEPVELEKPSTRSELAELSKQELIEKVMQYERQMEGSIPLRRMSAIKQEAPENEEMKDVQSLSQGLAASIQQLQDNQQQQDQQQEKLDKSPQLSAVSPPPPAPSPPPAAQDDNVKEEKKLTSPTLAAYAVKSPTNLHAVVSVQNEEEDDGEDDDEENEDELEDEDNDGEEGEDTRKARKGSADANGADDLEAPQQLVCLWRECNTPFESMSELNDHVAETHIGSGKASYSCDWQGCPRKMKPFTKRHKMYNHLRTHTGERPFKCLVPGTYANLNQIDAFD
ncbi:Zinc finger protein glis2 [Modicella reniformis]|uniref:Zinc finger protein glis2 n=1 Tax=Modicella reniformis TaxID=1440133 RepID=A0A9P6MDX3_9FUNG|nr:Zinc finger protein glis2 [Modicella reniformis]